MILKIVNWMYSGLIYRPYNRCISWFKQSNFKIQNYVTLEKFSKRSSLIELQKNIFNWKIFTFGLFLVKEHWLYRNNNFGNPINDETFCWRWSTFELRSPLTLQWCWWQVYVGDSFRMLLTKITHWRLSNIRQQHVPTSQLLAWSWLINHGPWCSGL